MCGISGCIVKAFPKEASSIYSSLVKFSDIRGQDGTGYTLLRRGSFITERWNKRAREIPFYIDLEVGDIIISQNRYAIFGLSEDNNQPIEYRNLSIVHNGVLYNFETQSKYLEERFSLKRDLRVDTEIIVKVLYKLLSESSPKESILELLQLLEGELACLCIDSNSHSLYSFMKNKILYKGEDEYGNIYFFSTLYIKNKVPQICKNIEEFKDFDIKIYSV